MGKPCPRSGRERARGTLGAALKPFQTAPPWDCSLPVRWPWCCGAGTPCHVLHLGRPGTGEELTAMQLKTSFQFFFGGGCSVTKAAWLPLLHQPRIQVQTLEGCTWCRRLVISPLPPKCTHRKTSVRGGGLNKTLTKHKRNTICAGRPKRSGHRAPPKNLEPPSEGEPG